MVNRVGERNLVFEEQYRRLGFRAQRHYPNEELLRFLGREFGLSDGKCADLRVLEVGCGSGGNLWMLAREGAVAHGVDISVTGLRLCREMLASWETSAALVRADFTTLPYRDGVFDIVLDIVSLQHLPLKGHRLAFAEIRRVLRCGGKFFSYHLGIESYSFEHGGGRLVDPLTVDNISNPAAPLSGNGITCFLDEDTSTSLLREAGFEDVKIEDVIKSYHRRTMHIQYLALEATKR
jgi:ubiquinone/menaquinone biosynthesis C-methylase UbiE